MTLEQKYPPHVEVNQEFEEETPSQVNPLLLSCSVGPCYTVVDATTSSGSPNSDAVITLPALTVSTLPGTYTGIGGKSLGIRYKEYGVVDIDFPITPSDLTADQVVEVVQNNSSLIGVTARKITIGSSDYVVFYTTSVGVDEYFSFTEPTGTDASSLFGFSLNYDHYAFPQYSQYDIEIPEFKFPDTLGVLSEAVVDDDEVRVFVQGNGTTLTEAKSDETILNVYDTATMVGSVDLTGLSYPDDLMDKVLEMTRYPESEKSVTFFAALRSSIITAYNECATNYTNHISDTPATGGAYHAATDAVNTLAYTSLDSDASLSIICAAFANLKAQFNAHDADAVPTWHGAAGPSSQMVTADPTDWADLITFHTAIKANFNSHIVDVGGGYHANADNDNGWTESLTAVDQTDVISEINAVWSSLASLQATTNYLVLETDAGGITIGDGNANTTIGLTDSDYEFVLEGVDDGDGDNYTPLVKIDGADLSAGAAAATVTGTADITALSLPDDVFEKTFIVGDGRHPQTFRLYEDLRRELVDGLNELLEDYMDHIGDTTFHQAADTTNVVSVTSVSMATSLADLYTAINDLQTQFNAHDTDAGPTWHRVAGGSHQSGAAVASSVATMITLIEDLKSEFNDHIVDVTGVPTFHITADTTNTITFGTISAGTYTTEILDVINGVMGSGYATLDGSNYLVLTDSGAGYESLVHVGSGTANTDLGMTAGTTYGVAYPAETGDEVWSDGSLVGIIVETLPDGHVDRFRLDREVLTTYKKNNCYTRATDLTYGAAGRPTPDLYNDGYNFTVKHDILRDGYGKPVSGGIGPLLVSYKALRKDVSCDADSPALLTFNSTDEIEAQIPPISTQNPLALALYYQKLNAPNSIVSGIGVSEVSDDYPDGTLQGYTDAFEFLQGYSVYAITPLTHNTLVHGLAESHVDAMRASTGQKERVVIVNPDQPTKAVDTTVGSGTDGESTGVADEFDTKLADIASLLTQQGLNPASLSATDGVYLDITSDDKRYNVSSVTGTVLSLRTSFPSGGNDDGYFTTDSISTTLVQENFSVSIKGASLSTRTEEAQAYNAQGKAFSNRAVWMVVSPEAVSVVDGSTTNVEGYYVAAGLAGLVSKLNPSQPMNSLAIAGFSNINYVYPYYNETQLNHIAAGGGMIVYTPESASSAIIRHALTTDLSSTKKECPNVTRALDFSAMYYRRIVTNFVGRYIIDAESLNILSMMLDGGTDYLVNNKVLLGAKPGKPQQVTSGSSTGIAVDIDVEVGLPGNVVTITLVV